jgi:hypothetical protein
MPWTREHLEWLTETGESIVTSCGKNVPVYEFRYDAANNEVMSNWARHFRNHYCLDTDLPHLKSPEQTNSEYLHLKFPDRAGAGPSIRAGDFSEILVADYLHFLREYYVPRTRYDRKIIGNESSKGSDVIGFKTMLGESNRNDELVVYEVKARLSENKVKNVLQDAIDHSSKDQTRLADSLNAIKQRLYDKNDIAGVEVVARFQRNVDAPYKTRFGAAAVITETSYCPESLAESSSDDHVSQDELEMIVIKGQQLMPLVHDLYERAANEA